jgi:transcriptional regulator with XRE-family HTH domain
MRLRDLRLRRALTQQDLARLSGVAATTIGAIERGVELPSMRTARRLAEALAVDLADIDEIQEAIDRELKKDPTRTSLVGQSSSR